MKLPPRVLTIAGSDSGGSAGIQADLKTLEAHGVFGTTAITIVTAQNTLNIQSVLPLPIELIGSQIDAVLSDIGADVVKTGLLGRHEVVELVASKVAGIPLVVDPVLVNGAGHPIVSPETMNVYRQQLFPLATIITPNLDEARWLTGITGHDLYQMAHQLYAFGSKTVLVKGGHLAGDQIVDVFFDGENFVDLTVPTLPIQNPHGVGCTFASAIAAELAKGSEVFTAVQTAQAYLQTALGGAIDWQVGQGRSPVNHHAL